MQDFMSFKGHFAVQTIDKNNQIIDQWEENNLIMEVARTTMSKILAKINSGNTINKIVLGTEGHIGGSIVNPKTSSEGFVKERNRLFSESVDIGDNETIDLMLNDLVKYTGNTNSTGTTGNWYTYIGPDSNGVSTNTINFGDTALWTDLGTDQPYTYEVSFDLPELNDADATNVAEDDTNAGSSVHILQADSSVTFTIDVVQDAANSGGGAGVGTSVFTEAALYSEDDIFAMKTFAAKIKDNTVLLRIIWTITF